VVTKSRTQFESVIRHLMTDPVLTHAAKSIGVSVRTVNRWKVASQIKPHNYQCDLGDGITQAFHHALQTAMSCGREYQAGGPAPPPARNTSGFRKLTKPLTPWSGETITISPEPARTVAPDLIRPGFEMDRRAATMSPEERRTYSEQFARDHVRPLINSPATPHEVAERLGSAPSGIRVGETKLLPGGIIGKRMA
jgi:hypothetical protein